MMCCGMSFEVSILDKQRCGCGMEVGSRNDENGDVVAGTVVYNTDVVSYSGVGSRTTRSRDRHVGC